MDLFPKYIIEGDSLIIGKVTYHKHLAEDKSSVRGGGWFRYSEDKSTMIFYDESSDFGRASLENVRECVKSGKVFTRDKIRCIAKEFKFAYYTGSELIEL